MCINISVCIILLAKKFFNQITYFFVIFCLLLLTNVVIYLLNTGHGITPSVEGLISVSAELTCSGGSEYPKDMKILFSDSCVKVA